MGLDPDKLFTLLYENNNHKIGRGQFTDTGKLVVSKEDKLLIKEAMDASLEYYMKTKQLRDID
jgi:hypothetical protein